MVLQPPQVHDPYRTVSRSRELVGEDEVKSLVLLMHGDITRKAFHYGPYALSQDLARDCPSNFPDQSCFPLSGVVLVPGPPQSPPWSLA